MKPEPVGSIARVMSAGRKAIVGIFDPYLKKLADYVDGMRAGGRQIREFNGSASVTDLLQGLPVRVGPGASSGIVLRGDTFVEMGSPDAGSCAFVLWTDNPSLIRDGKITLVGPDIPESEGDSLPFAQVLLVGGSSLGDAEHSALEQNQYISDRIEGYMVKSTPERMWTRVDKEVAARGFHFETLGKALMAVFKSEVPKVEAMEVLFVTSGKEDVQQLDDIAAQVRKIGKDIVRETWLARGYDILECTLGWDCSTCTDKDVCDEIRQVLKIRKKKKGKARNAAS